MILAAPASADPLDATWLATPGSAVYNTGANWSAGAVPTGTASFGASTQTGLSLSTNTTLGGWTFNADAAAYTIGNDYFLTFTGTGIVVNGGSINLTSAGYTYFQNASSAGSATINNSGNVYFQNASSAGNAAITNSNSGSVNFYGSSSAGNATIVSGNYGGVNFNGSSSAGNASISGGFVTFGDSSTGGNASIAIDADSLFVGTSSAGSASIVNNSATIRFWEHSSGGNAAFTNSATGVIDFGGMSGLVGDNPNSMGSLSGGGQVYLGSNRVTVGGNNLSTTFNGVISDCGASGSSCYATYFGGSTGGSLVKTGTGTLTLAGINLYTGATMVNAGKLSVDGSIATSLLTTANAGGTLTGTGTVGETLINGGTLAPGNSIGTLNVAGNLAFTSASTYAVEVSPSNADRVNVSGTATLGGAAVSATFAPGSYVTKQYTILNATGGVSGTFGSQVNTNLPTSFTSGLSYDAHNAYLDLTLSYTAPSSPSSPSFGHGLSSNQNSVGNTLVNYFDRNGGIPLAFGALTPTGLTQASGESGAGAQQPGFTAATQFVGALSDPTQAGRGGDGAPLGYADEGDAMNAYASTGHKRSGSERDAYAAITKAVPRMPGFVPRWNVWVSGFGGTQTTDGNATGGTSTSSSRIAGAAVGADYWLSPQTVAGFALAGGATTFNVAGGGGGQSDLFQVGGFVRHTVGSAYVTATAAYGWQNVRTDRMVGAEQLRAQFDTDSYTARLEGGDRFVTPWLGGLALTPYAAVQVTYLDLPAYAESTASGVGTFALAYAGRGVTSPRTELGLRSDRSFAISDAMLMVRGRAAWAHDTNTDRSASATFQSLPGASFVVNGASPAADAALTTAEAELRFVSGISVGATFEGEFSDVTRSYAGKGVVRYAW